MDFMPVTFKIERKNIIPILTITGVIGRVPGAENILLYYAVKIIEKAEKFNGKVMNLDNTDYKDLPENMNSVRFNIIFKNENDFMLAATELQKGLG